MKKDFDKVLNEALALSRDMVSMFEYLGAGMEVGCGPFDLTREAVLPRASEWVKLNYNRVHAAFEILEGLARCTAEKLDAAELASLSLIDAPGETEVQYAEKRRAARTARNVGARVL